MSGVVAFGAGLGRLELSFSSGAVISAGITTLHPSQALKCSIRKLADGTMAISDIQLSSGERAAKLNEMAKQAEAAEKNYRVELMRRGLH